MDETFPNRTAQTQILDLLCLKVDTNIVKKKQRRNWEGSIDNKMTTTDGNLSGDTGIIMDVRGENCVDVDVDTDYMDYVD